MKNPKSRFDLTGAISSETKRKSSGSPCYGTAVKSSKLHMVTLSLMFLMGLLCSCSSHRASSTKDGLSTNAPAVAEAPLASSDRGTERVFTNANVTMWVPSRAVDVWDGHTSVVRIGELTAPGVFVKDFKIELEIQVNDRDWELKQIAGWASQWEFQDHPELSMRDVQYGKQMRKDIWNADRTRRLLINAMIQKTDTYKQDLETAMKMINSIKPVN